MDRWMHGWTDALMHDKHQAMTKAPLAFASRAKNQKQTNPEGKKQTILLIQFLKLLIL